MERPAEELVGLRIAFFQGRYHTNMHPIVKQLKKRNEVTFLSQYTQTIENYSALEPTVVRLSAILYPIYLIVANLYERGLLSISMNDFLRIFGIPSIIHLIFLLRREKPDVIIIRNYYPTTFVVSTVAIVLGINIVFFDLDPKYASETKGGISKKLAKAAIKGLIAIFAPHDFVRITPIKGDPEENERLDNSYYLPFPKEPINVGSLTETSTHDKVRIICVGKYRVESKNHLLLLKAVNSLDHPPIEVRLVGELEDANNRNYQRIKKFVSDHGMGESVEIKTNVDHQRMEDEYITSDLFVLPSTNEPLGISLLEAMAYGLPIICSDTVGAMGYIIDGENGYIFESNDVSSLATCINKFVDQPAKIRQMGENSIEQVRNRHMPEQYEQKLLQVFNKEFDIYSN